MSSSPRVGLQITTLSFLHGYFGLTLDLMPGITFQLGYLFLSVPIYDFFICLSVCFETGSQHVTITSLELITCLSLLSVLPYIP